MQETVLIEEISQLLQRHHDRLDARLDLQQENLLRQLSRYFVPPSVDEKFNGGERLAVASSVHEAPAAFSTPMSWTQPNGNMAVEDYATRVEPNTMAQVVPMNDKTEYLSSVGEPNTLTQVVPAPSTVPAASWLDQVARPSTASERGSRIAARRSRSGPQSAGHPRVTWKQERDTKVSYAESTVGGTVGGCNSGNRRRSSWDKAGLLECDLAVKLGTTSKERVVADLEDQFTRLAQGEEILSYQIILDVVHHVDKFVTEQDITMAVNAVVTHQSQTLCATFDPSGEEGQPEESLGLDINTFMHMMLEDDIPMLNEAVIHIIRDAFEEEKLARQDQLNIISTNRSRNQGGYDDLPIVADIVGASVILINSLVIGLNSDIAQDHYIWRVLEYGFLAFFTLEVVYHMFRQGLNKFFWGRDWRWNLFDLILVLFAIVDSTLSEISASAIEGGQLQLLSRTLRLARLSRLVRLLRFKIFAELKQMIYGVMAGIRVLAWAILLLLAFIYMVSLVIRQTVGEDAESLYSNQFESVPWTMFTVFRCFTDGCTAPDGTPLTVYLYLRHGLFFMVTYVVVYLFVSIGIFNLIMATFIDNVMAVSAVRKQVERAGNAGKMKGKLTAIIVHFWQCDQDTIRKFKTFGNAFHNDYKDQHEATSSLQDVRVTREMLQLWMCHPDMISILEQLEIVNADHSRLFDALDCDLSGELEGSELVQGMMALRGPTEKIDVVSTMLATKYMTAMLKRVESCICESHPVAHAHHRSLNSTLSGISSVSSVLTPLAPAAPPSAPMAPANHPCSMIPEVIN